MRGDPFLVNRDYYGLLSQSWNGAWLPGFVKKKARMAFLAEAPRWRIMSFVTPSGPGAFFIFYVLISASSSSFWMASVMHPSAGMFSESCFFISFLTCLVLSLVSLTVLSSWNMWAKQFSSLVSLQSCVVSFSILRDAVCSCHVVLVWWSLCRVNSALALSWFSTFTSVGSCSCAILALLTASCSSCSWLFHPECVFCVCHVV